MIPDRQTITNKPQLKSGSTSTQPTIGTMPPVGIELDEQGGFGHDSGWAPQGGQQPSNDASKTRSEPTHVGKTQSTTNSQ